MFLRTSSVPQSNQGPLGPSNQGQMLHSKVSVPHPYLNPTKAHYRSIQPKPKCFTQWFGCVPNGAGPLRQPHQGQSFQPHPSLLLAGSTLQTKWPPIGPPLLLAGSKVPKVSIPLLLAGSKVPKRHRLWWGSAVTVSDACPRRAVTCRLRIRSKVKASSPTHPLLLAGS